MWILSKEYGIGNSLFDIQYLTDDNAHLKK